MLNCKTGYLKRLKTKWDLQVGHVNSEIHHCDIIRKLTAKFVRLNKHMIDLKIICSIQNSMSDIELSQTN